MSDDDKSEKVEESGAKEIRGKPAGLSDLLLGTQKDGIATDEGGDKIKEIVPKD
jgi:hypothetical protein